MNLLFVLMILDLKDLWMLLFICILKLYVFMLLLSSTSTLGTDSRFSFQKCDTGPGMTLEQAGRVFERFQQASPLTHVTMGGSGLGLWIARSKSLRPLKRENTLLIFSFNFFN